VGRLERAGTIEMKIWVLPEQRERLKTLARELSPRSPRIRHVIEVLFEIIDTQPSVWKSAVSRWRMRSGLRA